MGHRGGEVGGTQILKPPSDLWQMREAENGSPNGLARMQVRLRRRGKCRHFPTRQRSGHLPRLRTPGPTLVVHGHGNLERGRVQGKSGAEPLDQGLLAGPQPKEEPGLALTFRCGERPSLLGSERLGYCSIRIMSWRALLDIHAKSPAVGERNQPMPAAVTDIELDTCRRAAHQGDRLAVFQGGETEIVVPAAQPFAENRAKRGAAQDELPLRPGVAVAMPSRTFLFVQPFEGGSFPFGMRRQVDMIDDGMACRGKRLPPVQIRICANRCHDCVRRRGARIRVA